MSFITSNFKHCYILVDDYRVPGNDAFGYDRYQKQACEHDYVKDDIQWRSNEYSLYYPAYEEHTSPIHPLRGWGLYVHGMPASFLTDFPELVKLHID